MDGFCCCWNSKSSFERPWLRTLFHEGSEMFTNYEFCLDLSWHRRHIDWEFEKGGATDSGLLLADDLRNSVNFVFFWDKSIRVSRAIYPSQVLACRLQCCKNDLITAGPDTATKYKLDCPLIAVSEASSSLLGSSSHVSHLESIATSDASKC